MDAYSTLLTAYLAEPGRTQSALGEAIGKSQAAIHRYASGDRFPDRDTATRIETATHGQVPVGVWTMAAAKRLGIDLGVVHAATVTAEAVAVS